MSTPTNPDMVGPIWLRILLRFSLVLGLFFVFLLGIKGFGEGFMLLGRDHLQVIFVATKNPLIGLMVGILATSVMQSSSITTSMIVALVAAPVSPLPLENAIPMVMGANIGTTVTNTIVSLAHLGHRNEFQRAFAVATCHDVFNYMAVAVLLPLELYTGFLRKLSAFKIELGGLAGIKYQSPLKGALQALYNPLETFLQGLFADQRLQGVALLLLGGIMIFGAISLLVKILHRLARSRMERIVNRGLGAHALLAIAVGMVITVMVQSSSITTSLLVPLAGAGLLGLEQAFPIVLGANLGTTVTALTAALGTTGPNTAAGIQIALVHLLFNLSATLLIYPLRRVRAIPLHAARWLAGLATRSKKLLLLYILFLFYGIPLLLIFLDKAIRL